MKKTIVLLIGFIAFAFLANAQTGYKMWETIYIVPKKGSIEELKKGLSDHNKEFHSTAPFTAHVWNVMTGPHEGQLLWVMGPCTFTDLDSAPGGEAKHDADWDANVEAHCEKVHEVKYWKLNEKVSYSPEGAPGEKVIWTTYDIKPFEMYRFNAMLEKVAEVYRQKKYDHSFSVYESQLDSGDGQDIVLEWQFEKWAFFDEEDSFKKDYEEIHGEGTWTYFMEEYRDVVESSFDELAVYMKELSGVE